MWQPVVEPVPPFLTNTFPDPVGTVQILDFITVLFFLSKTLTQECWEEIGGRGKFKKKNEKRLSLSRCWKGPENKCRADTVKCLFLCVYVPWKCVSCFNCRDRLTGNDAVGTTYLNLAKIASSGGEIEGTPISHFITLKMRCTHLFQNYATQFNSCY